MMREASARGHALAVLQQEDLIWRDGRVLGYARDLSLTSDDHHWYRVGDRKPVPLETFDAVLMRKDPPFDMEYIYSTYLLELAESRARRSSTARVPCATITKNWQSRSLRSSRCRHW
jgi:glutathione synthase